MWLRQMRFRAEVFKLTIAVGGFDQASVQAARDDGAMIAAQRHDEAVVRGEVDDGARQTEASEGT